MIKILFVRGVGGRDIGILLGTSITLVLKRKSTNYPIRRVVWRVVVFQKNCLITETLETPESLWDGILLYQ
jgi:hypothetical protein